MPASVASAPRRPTCRKSGFSTRHQAIRSQAGGQGGRFGRRAPGQAAEAGRRQPGAERVEVLVAAGHVRVALAGRSEENPSELQSLMRISYACFCVKKKKAHK